MIEHTFSLIKPDATARNIIGKIITILEIRGLKIVAQQMLSLSEQQAYEFYQEHRQRPFFHDLIKYITSGPIVAQVLQGENAINTNRDIMGHTSPDMAADQTIRKLFGESIERNSIHGSDSAESAKREISLFFPQFSSDN